MNIKVTNKIEEKIEEYQIKNRVSKTWVYEQIGISKQRFYTILQTDNISIHVAARISKFLGCKIDDLFDIEIVEAESDNKDVTIDG